MMGTVAVTGLVWLYAASQATYRLADSGEGSGNAFDFLSPIISTGIVGIFLLMILFRIKIMPVYVYDSAKAEWDRERTQLLQEKMELKASLAESGKVYTEQVIPTLTRVLDAERELVELRRAESLRRRT